MQELAKRIIDPEVERWSVSDIEIMADRVAKSKLFGLDSAQAFTLMLLAQSEGIHPIKAVQRYHVIQGRPTMKADAMLADFLMIGGTVKWVTESNDREKCEAIFQHPKFAPDGKSIRFGMNDAKAAGLTGNPTWQKYPANMLRARVVSNGVRMLAPGIVAGLYTTEEGQDFDPVCEPIQATTVEPHEHYAVNHDNKTGHGSGAYASPPIVETYQQWVKDHCDVVNTQWLDFLTDKKTGEIRGKAQAELVNPWQLSGHLLKWAKSCGLVNAPDETRAGQRDKFAAVAWERDHEGVTEEATQYCRQLWRDAKEKLKLLQSREPGCDDELSEDDVLDEISEKGAIQ